MGDRREGIGCEDGNWGVEGGIVVGVYIDNEVGGSLKF